MLPAASAAKVPPDNQDRRSLGLRLIKRKRRIPDIVKKKLAVARTRDHGEEPGRDDPVCVDIVLDVKGCLASVLCETRHRDIMRIGEPQAGGWPYRHFPEPSVMPLTKNL